MRPELIPPTDVRYCVGKQCDNGMQFIIEYNQLARCGAFHLCDVLGELHDDDDDDDAVPRRRRIPAPKSADSCHHVSTLSYFTRYVYYIVGCFKRKQRFTIIWAQGLKYPHGYVN